jgi:CheY-like chemotaxis protein
MTVEGAAKLLDAFAHLVGVIAWPLGIGAVLYLFYEPIKKFLSSISEFSFKGAGIEWTARSKTEAAAALGAAIGKQQDQHPEAIAQQTRLVGQIVDSISPALVRGAKKATVLWVDDHPENNINERRSLEALGVTFVTSLSTDDALNQAHLRKYDLIISDLGRTSDQMAGLTLLDKLRAEGIMTPYIIYAGQRGLTVKDEAKGKGAFDVTNRPDKLFELVVSVIGGQI